MLTLISNLLRVLQLITTIFRYIISPLILLFIKRLLFIKPRKINAPEQVRFALEALGGAWIKLGQALALRFDLIPPEYCYELFKLLNKVNPFPFKEVRKIIKKDLKRSPEEIFQLFEKESFAAASIGQVHKAVLPTGEKVAVKVQRPSIRRIIYADIRLMYLAAGFLDRTKLFGATRLRDVIDEFANWTADELNYLTEARHAQNLHLNAQGDPLERHAKVYVELSSPRVLTMEFIEGIPLIEIIYALKDKDVEYLNSLEKKGYDLYQIASHLTWNLLNQTYRFGYFHADLHPANLFVLPGNAIAYVDFGIVGNISNEVRESLSQYAWHLYQGNIDKATEEFMRWVSPSDETNVEAARNELIRIIDDYLSSLRDPKSKKGAEGSSVFEVDLLNAIRRHQMMVSSNIVTYLKALVTADAVVFELAPDFDLQKIENRFFGRLIQQDILEFLEPVRLTRFVYEYSYRINRVFDLLESFRQSGRSVTETIREVRGKIQGLALFAVLIVIALISINFFTLNKYISWIGIEQNTMQYILIGILFIISVLLLYQGRKLPLRSREVERDSRAQLRSRWEQPPVD